MVMAKSPPKQGAGPEGKAAAKPKKKRRLLKWMLALLLLTASGAAAWYFMEGQGQGKAEAVQPKPPVFVMLEPFTVNLQPEEGDQYLQVGLVFKVSDSAAGEAIKLHMPEIRNRILLLLSSKHASELSTVDGKQKLSAEIMAEARRPLAPQPANLGIVNVFFTAFVIQ